jgi:hypothetical protein
MDTNDTTPTRYIARAVAFGWEVAERTGHPDPSTGHEIIRRVEYFGQSDHDHDHVKTGEAAKARAAELNRPTGEPCPNGGPDHVRRSMGRKTCAWCDDIYPDKGA